MIKLAPLRSQHILLSLAAVGVVGLLWFRGLKTAHGLPAAPSSPAVTIADTPSAPHPASKRTPDPVVLAVKSKTFEWFRVRPFAVVKSSGKHEWTAEDGRTPDAILDLAHNDLEVQRLMDENDRIKRRQLVYRRETVPALLDRARNSGEPLRSFTLPALDGQEIEVEVTNTQVEKAFNGGAVSGRIKGHFNSMVSVGFVNGYESFNVFSPEDGLYLVADAREPGEVMVKEIDPNKYAPADSGESDFIANNQPSTSAPK